MSLDKKHGFEKIESGLSGRAIDFAKFGSLSCITARGMADT
jgi:hypothetical protein